jgi:mediator of RNA polymerase II transcription subunit 6
LTSLFHVNSAFKETQDMMEFFPSRGYSWKQPPQQLTAEKDQNKSASPTAAAAAGTAATGTTEKTTTTTKSVLRAQETLMFRHWMDRAIEVSGQKIMQQRHMIDTPTTEQAENNALKPSTSSIDLTASSSSQRGKTKRFLYMKESAFINNFI